MGTRGQIETNFGLASTEMEVVLVRGNRLVEVKWFVHVDEQMMMAHIWGGVPGVGDTHVAEPETTPEGASDFALHP